MKLPLSHSPLTRLVCAAFCAGTFLVSVHGQTTAREPEMKFGIPIVAGPMDSVLLKDYRPEVSLVVKKTEVAKARFPVIDAHTHTGMSHIRTAADVDAWVRTMDEVGVEYTVVFTGVHGDNFARQVALFAAHRDRFQLWCDLDREKIEEPGYPQRAAAAVERCHAMGARGIGEITDKGWGIQRETLPEGKRLHFDDARLDLAWQACARLKMPVNMHIADHPSAWQPLGPKQERTPDFQTFNLHGKDVLSYEALLASRDRLLLRHPKTVFIACHFSNQGNDLAALGKVLERFPNLYLDLSARDYEIGRQPRSAAAFLTKYKDRVMFGTDMERDAAMYHGWWRLLETADEFIPGRIWWPYYGLALPDPVLKALYRDNAKRLLNWKPW
ncbi:MAG: amidohydrolase family protein [Bryobacterales bacterium]|nr:amidohydrolase family protein [Bryobacterales bacterium]